MKADVKKERTCHAPGCTTPLGHRNRWGFCKNHEQYKRRVYYDMHKEHMQDYGKQYYKENRDEMLAYVNQYRKINKDILTEKRSQLRRGDKTKYLQKESKNAWYRFRYSTKKRKLKYTISRDFYEELLTKPCHYCGMLRSSTSLSSWIDRVDNEKGYLIDNVLPCCPTCNKLKSDYLTKEEIEEIIKLLKKLRNKELIW